MILMHEMACDAKRGGLRTNEGNELKWRKNIGRPKMVGIERGVISERRDCRRGSVRSS